LIYERIKIKGSLDFGNQGLFMKMFLMFLLFACSFVFLNNKTKMKLSEQENKKRRYFVVTSDHHKDH